MEQPLLEPAGRLSSSFAPGLSQIPEDSQAFVPQTFRERSGSTQISPIIPCSPSCVKYSIVYGSPQPSPRSPFSWGENPRQRQFSNEAQERRTVERGFFGKLSRELSESSRQPKGQSSDDTDNIIIGSAHSGKTSLADSKMLDLDINSPATRNQTPALMSVKISKASSDGDLACYLESSSYQSRPGAPQPPSGEPSIGCNICTGHRFHRANTAPVMTVMEDKAPPHFKTASIKSRSGMIPDTVVTQAFLGLLLYLAVGVAIYWWRRDAFSGTVTHNFVDAIYFCIVTLCTIGYGDIAPTTPFAKVFSCLFVLVGFGFIDVLLGSMVNYVLDHQETLLMNSVFGGHHQRTQKYLVDMKKGRMRIRMKVALAFGVVIACIGLGTLVAHFVESLGWVDSFYLACMSVTTVGYGDHSFETLAGRIFASLWLLVSTLAVARSLLYLAESRIDRRHRAMAKKVLNEKMSFGDLVAADLDNDGSISKSEFVVYKLKKMGKIQEKDVAEVCRQFNLLSTDFSGKITLSCLINLDESSVHSQ